MFRPRRRPLHRAPLARAVEPQLDLDGQTAVARLGVGVIMFMHGLQKVGFFGARAGPVTMEDFTHKLQIPPPLAAIAILTEVVGGACLILGSPRASGARHA